jgi:nucleoid DNA-binding protein
MNATNFGTNKDFRKTIDIRQKVRKGKIEKKIYLPPEDFAYGLPNRPPTPFKDVIYNAYGNRAEDIIRNEYDNYIKERSIKNIKPPEVITRYINPKAEEYKMRDLEKKNGGLSGFITGYEKKDKENEKPLYKLKMFQDVGSKVAEEVKLFKTYHPYRKKKKVDDGVDYLINKVQGEIEQNDKQKMNGFNNFNDDHQAQNLTYKDNQFEPVINQNEIQPKSEYIPQ